MVSKLETTDKASQRTANRIQEHNEHDWEPVLHSSMVRNYSGEPKTLFKCDITKCDWLGWLFDAEFTDTSQGES